MSGFLDLAMIGAALIWLLSGGSTQQVTGWAATELSSPSPSHPSPQALLWFCVLYAFFLAIY